MFHIKRPVEPTALEETMNDALSELKGHDAGSDEYAQIVKQLTKLNAIKSTTPTDRLSKDTLALVLGNIIGILVIVNQENAHVLVSKALPFVGKFK